MPVSISQTNLLELHSREKSSDSTEFQSEAQIVQSSSVINFPLYPTSEDHLPALQDDQPGSFFSFLAEDYKLYLTILQAASSLSSSETDNPVLEFDTISANIINTLDKSQGAAPLHYASINGNVPLVTWLLENDAEVDIWDKNKKVTPFICAAAFGHLDIVKILMDYDCNLNAGLSNDINTTIEQHSGLLWAIRAKHLPVVRFLLDNNVCQNSIMPFSETPIHASIMAGNSDILRMLLAAQDSRIKADFQLGPGKNSPLHLATSGEYENSFELCKILIEDGNVNVNSLNSSDKTPLHKAMASRNADIVKLLIFHSARVNAVDNEGRTPLFCGINDKRESLDCMEALIEEGKCNVNHQDKWGNTPLHLAGSFSCPAAAEILLLNGADFSLKAAGGISALSILKKKISATSTILNKAFDRAVTLTNFEECEEAKTQQDCKVVVDFKYVLPTAASSTKYASPSAVASQNNSKAYSRMRRMSSIFKDMESNNRIIVPPSTRNETAKIKCLVKEGYFGTLLHPVIQSFLELKWQKAKSIFMPIFFFKGILVLLTSFYVQLPYVLSRKLKEENKVISTVDSKEQLMSLRKLYLAMVAMATLRGVMEIVSIMRAPKQRLKSLHMWASTVVLLTMLFYMNPEEWQDDFDNPFRRAMAALGILLVWMDIWIDMARLPRLGLSIRVFLQVLKGFSSFVLPHFCLLAGFILSFRILFPDDAEFQSVGMGIPKIIRIMAGDVTIPKEGSEKALTVDDTDDVVFSKVIVVYMFTACVLTVSVVLMDLLIGLAVNDIKRIYADASTDRLVKQTILLNNLETSVCGNWTKCCCPKGVFSRFINLFPASSTDKTITFSPYDPRDLEISDDQRKDLLRIGSVNREVTRARKEKSCSSLPASSNNVRLLRKPAIIDKLKNIRADDQQHLLIENIDKLKLVLSYLEDKLPKK